MFFSGLQEETVPFAIKEECMEESTEEPASPSEFFL